AGDGPAQPDAPGDATRPDGGLHRDRLRGALRRGREGARGLGPGREDPAPGGPPARHRERAAHLPAPLPRREHGQAAPPGGRASDPRLSARLPWRAAHALRIRHVKSSARATPALPIRSRTDVVWSSTERGMRKRILGVLCGVMACAVAGAADPLDLRDARPRPIRVAFEVSPTERPDAQNVVYSEPLPAWLEPGA